MGNQDGMEYLVMEYLEGETLADRLVRGAFSLEQTLRYGVEIADALDKALTPILMTALVTGLALLPLVVGGARAGQEIEHPMAVVIVGGLLSSTALNLLVMPAFYLRWGKKRVTARGSW